MARPAVTEPPGDEDEEGEEEGDEETGEDVEKKLPGQWIYVST